jgi:hypothetical protein
MMKNNCNPSYSEGRDGEDCSLRPDQAKSWQDPISTKQTPAHCKSESLCEKWVTRKHPGGTAEMVAYLSTSTKHWVQTPVLPKIKWIKKTHHFFTPLIFKKVPIFQHLGNDILTTTKTLYTWVLFPWFHNSYQVCFCASPTTWILL